MALAYTFILMIFLHFVTTVILIFFLSLSHLLSLSSEKGKKSDRLKMFYDKEFFWGGKTTDDLYWVVEKKFNKSKWTLKSTVWKPHKLSHLLQITPDFYFKNLMTTDFWKLWNSTLSMPELISSFDMRMEVALPPSHAIFSTPVSLLKGWETLAQKPI